MRALVLIALLLLSNFGISKLAYSLGLGLQIGSTGAIVGKEDRLADRTWKASMGWYLSRHHTNLILSADYIIQDQNFSRLDGEQIIGYAGIGGVIETSSDVGVRFPFGVAWEARKHPIEVFAEIAPTLFIAPSTSVGIGLNLGVLWFFK